MSLAIEVKDVCFSYGKREILKNISLSVKEGEILVLTGESGCGKTTLCNILCGVIPASVKGKLTGQVRIMGEDIAGASLAQTAKRIGMVFQNADHQIICTTVEDELAFAQENLCVEPEKIRMEVDEMLARFRMEHLRLMNPARLSGGQKKLVTIASTLMLNPPILVLDEPMTGLDKPGRDMVFDTIEKLHEAGKTLVIIEHDPALYPAGARIVRMEEGRL